MPEPAQDRPTIRFKTALGDIVIELRPDRAPLTSRAFLKAASTDAWGQAAFVRVVRAHEDLDDWPIEVVQASVLGSPAALPPVPHESTRETGLRHVDGAVSLARLTAGEAPAGSFFIVFGDQPELDFGGRRQPDGLGFAVFGHVVEGLAVARAILDQPTHDLSPLPDRPKMARQYLVEPLTILEISIETEREQASP